MTGPHCRRRSAPLLLAAVALWAGLAAAAAAQGNAAADRAALEALYDATGGPGWTDRTNWNTAAPIGEWFGVTTDAAGRVTRLELPGNGLTGPIPDALGNLVNLGVLNLGGNALTGPIPSELGRLVNLEALRLWDNELTGPVPAWLGNLTGLRSLNLRGNDLTGSIPADLGTLVNLGVLDLGDNALTGSVPAWLGNLTGLRWLHLGRNELTGPIPAELGNLANLESLYLHLNALTGPIQSELGRLVNLEGLSLWDNELTGPVPAWLGNLTGLRSLNLGGNALTGPIPSELGRLVNLEALRLWDNELTGPVPAWLGNLTGLRSLNLRGNDLTGSIPADLGTLVNLGVLDLGDNALTGSVPAWLGNLTGLRWLHLGRNELTGPIPAELGNLANLESLYLHLNALTGPIQSELGRLVNLEGLSLWDNELTGPVPAELGNLANLESLVLSWNPLSGTLPQRLTQLARLTELDIRHTGLCAPADAEFQEWLAAINFSGATCNRPPQSVDAIPAQALTESGPALGVSMEAYFSDPDDDRLTYAAASSNAGAVTAFASGDTVWLVPGAAGTARVTVTAQDPDGLSATQAMTVTTAASAGPQSDREVLEVFYDSTSGASWTNRTNWKTSAPLGEWHGVTTDPAGRVTGLELNENGLTGVIPPALGDLVNLRGLSLWGNELTGPIPDELGNLVNLESLDLGSNGLTGPIPAALGNLSNLRMLDFWHSWGLSGPLPGGLESSSLEELGIFATQTCAPTAWGDWLDTIEFEGRLCEGEPEVTIDVAVVYTQAAREEAGGTAEIEAVIDLMVAETNEAYQASGVYHRLALVARSEVQYAEAGDLRDIHRLADPSDGYMDGVHAMRDRTGADLVHLVFKHQDHPFAGVASFGWAFGLTCQYCGGGTFAHELGHNMGLRHDRYLVHHNEGGVSPHPAYGYVNQQAFVAGAARSRRWYTIMSYATQCADADISCQRLPRFSNPRQSYNGDPLGIPFGEGSGMSGPADAAAVLNATGPAVALWRDRPAGSNLPPAAVGTLPDRSLTLHGALDVDVSPAFVDPDGDRLTYAVSSSALHVVTVLAAGARVTLTAMSAGTATIRVTATDPGGLSATQAFTVTVAMRAPFTDDPIVAGVTPVRAVHFTELRAHIDALREAAGLGRFRWTDPVLRAGVTPVRLVHLLELREALGAAYTAAGRAAPRWTDAAPTAGTTPIRAAHLTELRAAVVALE